MYNYEYTCTVYLEFKRRYTQGSRSDGISENIAKDKDGVGNGEARAESQASLIGEKTREKGQLRITVRRPRLRGAPQS